MSDQAEPQEAASGLTGAFAEGDLGKIQGILFGDQARKTEERLSAIEGELRDLIAGVDDRLADAVSTLERSIGAEHDARKEAVDEARRERRALEKTVEKTAASEQRAREKDVARLQGMVEELQTALDEAAAGAAGEAEADRRKLADALRGVADTLDGTTGTSKS